MKTINLFLTIIFFSFTLTSCVNEVYVNNPDNYVDNSIPLPDLIEGYDLWYVDYERTTGNGEVPFLSRAFTISMRNGRLYANNNLAGFGTTGNGLGIVVGGYSYFSDAIDFYHDIYGRYELEVIQIASNRIKLYDSRQNTTYFLEGHQRNSFDYDRVFYENIDYFLQEYNAWEKVYTSRYGALNEFDKENFLKFISGGNNDTFRSSQDRPGASNIYWDFTGKYGVLNAGNGYEKNLTLDYDFWSNETFRLSVINDSRIRLFHYKSNTTYEFVGIGFIQYLKQPARKVNSKSKIKAI
jgi:hypothetical protein